MNARGQYGHPLQRDYHQTSLVGETVPQPPAEPKSHLSWLGVGAAFIGGVIFAHVRSTIKKGRRDRSSAGR